MKPEYSIIPTARKTMALEITRDLRILVRVPRGAPQEAIDRFISTHRQWMETHMIRMRDRVAAYPEPTQEEALNYRRAAKEYIPGRVAYYSKEMGVTAMGITITGARTRFGSCSGKNRLSFSWRLMAHPTEAIDYVVVHELAHIVHKNHGTDFYALVAAVLPDWKSRRQLLK